MQCCITSMDRSIIYIIGSFLLIYTFLYGNDRQPRKLLFTAAELHKEFRNFCRRVYTLILKGPVHTRQSNSTI